MDPIMTTPSFEESIQKLYDTCEDVRIALTAALVYGEKGGTICDVEQFSSCRPHR